MKDKTAYKTKCVLTNDPQYLYEKEKNYYSCWFVCKIIDCENKEKIQKQSIICKVLNKTEAPKLKNYKKGQIIKVSARINKTIRITESPTEFIID